MTSQNQNIQTNNR